LQANVSPCWTRILCKCTETAGLEKYFFRL
jgi:hypothetical protein